MKVLIVNTYDYTGGAARAAARIHWGLRKIGIDSYMYVKQKNLNDSSIIIGEGVFDKILSTVSGTLSVYPSKWKCRSGQFLSTQWLPDRLLKVIDKINPDLINLHWINAGFVRTETIAKIKQPIIWTMHDMWPFTGGCHYSYDCKHYTINCGNCPMLKKNGPRDLSYKTLYRKKKSWSDKNITLVSPSKWLAEEASKSSLFRNNRIEVINNGIDTNVYKPVNQKFARKILNLPEDVKLVLLIAPNILSDTRKGGNEVELLADSVLCFKNMLKNTRLLIVGSNKPCEGADKYEIWKYHYFLGKLTDDISLSLAYAAADVLVTLSRTDNLPNTIAEASACGIPTVAYEIGGIPEMIHHRQTGYLAPPFNFQEILDGLEFTLKNLQGEVVREKISKFANMKYNDLQQATKYYNLFKDVLTG
jgi:glycosyltransferase involved in cell wall biosynthesis